MLRKHIMPAPVQVGGIDVRNPSETAETCQVRSRIARLGSEKWVSKFL